MLKTFTAVAAATAMTAGAFTPALAAPAGFQKTVAQPGDGQLVQVQYGGGRCYAGERPYDCRERLRWERQYGNRYQWRDGRYYDNRCYYDNRGYYDNRRDNDGAAVAAAILGFALGAAILGSQDDRNYYYSNRGNRSWHSRCAARYRSFDRGSGTYIASNGYRRYCRL